MLCIHVVRWTPSNYKKAVVATYWQKCRLVSHANSRKPKSRTSTWLRQFRAFWSPCLMRCGSCRNRLLVRQTDSSWQNQGHYIRRKVSLTLSPHHMLKHILRAGHNFLCKITNIHLPLQNKQLVIKNELLFLTEWKGVVVTLCGLNGTETAM